MCLSEKCEKWDLQPGYFRIFYFDLNCPGYMDTEMCANMAQSRKDECTVRIPAGRWRVSCKIEYLYKEEAADVNDCSFLLKIYMKSLDSGMQN